MISKIDSFFFQMVDTRIFAVIRITSGVLMTLWVLAAYPNWFRDYHSEGMLSLYVMGSEYPWFNKWFSVVDVFDGYVPIIFWWWFCLFVSLAFTLGFSSKLMCLLLLILHTSFQHRNYWASNAEQTVFRMICFYSLFMPLGRNFSIDALLFKNKNNLSPIWSLRMMQLHCCVVYSVSTYWKIVKDKVWLSGETMYYVIYNPIWSKFPFPELFLIPGVSLLATWGSLLLEGSFSILVWFPRLRKYIAFIAIAFQFVIAIFLNHVGFFSLSMACALVSFLRWGDLKKG